MEGKKVSVLYMPVLHKGYGDFVRDLEEKGVTEIYLVSDDILESHEELDYINRKDRIRALPHDVALKGLASLTQLPIKSLTIKEIFSLHEERASFVMPREDINLFIYETYFGGHGVEYVNVFLRRNEENTREDIVPQSEVISSTAFEQEMIGRAILEAERGADWWRRVGAVLVKDGEVVSVAHNDHMPEEEIPNVFGDARSLYKKGININYSTASHAEIGVIGEAARKGVATKRAELYVTDFPCPYCARLIAKAGIKKVYFLRGYAVLDGDDFFKEMGIDVVKVTLPE